MTKIVQLVGGSATQQNAYTGLARELTVDESNHDLRLHDGSTPGGHVIQSQDNADQRYQQRSLELDGFDFSVEQRGILTRLGPSDYRLRKIAVHIGNLTLTNPDGYAGDFTIALKTEINTPHNWLAQQVFSGEVGFDDTSVILYESNPTFAAGITIPDGQVLDGNVTGNVTGDLTGDSEGTHTGAQIGDVDVRGHVLLLDDAQIHTDAIADLDDFVKLFGFPGGGIILWSGTAGNVPVGWALCNGLNGTPDLRNKFVRGAGVGAGFDEAGVTGGVDEVTPSGVSVSAGAHTHTLSGNVATSSTGASLTKVFKQVDAADQTGCMDNVTLTDPGHNHAQGGTADSSGAHTHDITLDPQENRPEYYALCYIMKL